MFPTYKIPVEVGMIIFSYLSYQDLASCSVVSENWNKLSSDDVLWKRFFDGFDIKPDNEYKSWMAKHSVKSVEMLAEKVKGFCKIVKANQTGYLNCAFPGSKTLLTIKSHTRIVGFDLESKNDYVVNLFLLKKYNVDYEHLKNTLNIKSSTEGGSYRSDFTIFGYLPTDKESKEYKDMVQIKKNAFDGYLAHIKKTQTKVSILKGEHRPASWTDLKSFSKFWNG